jgi:hypothetical protein
MVLELSTEFWNSAASQWLLNFNFSEFTNTLTTGGVKTGHNVWDLLRSDQHGIATLTQYVYTHLVLQSHSNTYSHKVLSDNLYISPTLSLPFSPVPHFTSPAQPSKHARSNMYNTYPHTGHWHVKCLSKSFQCRLSAPVYLKRYIIFAISFSENTSRIHSMYDGCVVFPNHSTDSIPCG